MKMRHLNLHRQSINVWLSFAFLVLLSISELAFSQKIYYIDSQSGNDLNNGTSEVSAWRTIDKLNNNMYLIKPTDIIRFKKGASYEGQINITVSGNDGQPIIFESYGSGDNPLISGTHSISMWKQYKNNIYRAKTDKNSLNAFINSNQLVLARTPNTGNYFRVNTGGTNNTFTDTELSQNINFWAGSTCRVRTIDYTWEICKVSAYSNQSVSLQSSTNFTIKPNQIYYFDNLLAALDTANEWYSSGDSLYVYFSNPSDTSLVDASVYPYGVQITSGKNIIIRNLSFTKQGTDGINLVSCSNVEISDNSFSDIIGKAVGMSSVSNITVSTNTMENCRSNGISGFQVSNSNFLFNTIKNIGLVPGYGDIISGMTGIYLNGDGSNNLIKGNKIENTGYNGIRSDTRNSRIEDNTVKSPLLMVKDGAGIYTWGTGSTNVTIRNNYIENINNVELYGYNNWSFGIYLDDYSYGNSVIGNIVNDKYSPAIFLHNSYNDIVDSNTVYGTSINVSIDQSVTGSTYLNTFRNNNIFTPNRNISSLNLNSSVETTFGTFENNIYFNPFTRVTIACKTPSTTTLYFDLPKWKNYSGQDNYSKESFIKWDEYEVTDTVSSNFIVNGTFNTDLNSWDGYQSNFVREWTTNNTLDGGCAKMHFSSNSPTYGAFRTFGYTINYQKDKFYTVSFNSTSNSFINMYLRDNEVPSNLNEKICLDNTFSHYSYTFKAANDFGGKILFNTDASSTFTGDLYIDNVELFEVNALPNDYSDSCILLYNADYTDKSFDLGTNKYTDTYGNEHISSINLAPCKSAILIRTGSNTPPVDKLSDQTIQLKAGWNTISFDIIPQEVKIADVIQPVVQSGALVKMQDEGGNFMVETDGDWFNNLDSIDIRKGYNIKVNFDSQLKIRGSAAPKNIVIPLTEGYNILGYPLASARKALSSFQALMDDGSLVKVQDESGNFIIKTGSTWFSNIDSLKPGKGYHINVNRNTNLEFSYLKSSFLKSQSAQNDQSNSYFLKSYKGNPYASMNFIIKDLYQNSVGLSQGDEIGIFDGTTCVGSYIYNGENTIGMSAGMTDPMLETSGFTEGDSISFQIYKTNQKELLTDIGLEFEPGQQNTFASRGTSSLRLSKQITSISDNLIKQNSIHNYPNPFLDKTTFEFTVDNRSNIFLAVCDLSGKEIIELVNKQYASGKYEVTWDGRNSIGELLAPGVYLYTFRSGNTSSCQKLILLNQ